MKRHFLSIVLLLAMVPVAQASTNLNAELQAANQALAARDYDKAYALFASHAAKNPLAQFTLGLFYQNGWGRPADPIKACRRFEIAAHGNIPAAQQFFGDCLAHGTGRAVDGKTAVAWYRKAGANGDFIALCSAGSLYIAGKIVEKDVQQGLALCTQAAQANSPPAMLKLADYYRKGTVVPKNLTSARYWYQQAAERNVPEAQYRFGIMLGEGQGGTPDPAKARFWLETAASAGYTAAYLPTAILYANVKPDPKTGALAPAYLAKIYMWNSAARASTSDPAQLAEITRIAKLVDKVMPPSWKPELDKKVAAHLAKYGR